MAKPIWKFWGLIRHVLSVRGLLQWIGVWQIVVTLIVSQAVAVWSSLKGVAAPIAVVIGLVSFASVAVALLALRYGKNFPAIPPSLTEGAESRLPVASEPEVVVRALLYAPNPLIEHRKSGSRDELILTTDKERSVITPDIGPLACAERYEAEYKMEIVPHVLKQVSGERPVTCQITGVRDPHTGTISALADVLRSCSREGSASVLLNFRDSDDNQFGRRFTVHRNADDSITWIPGPVTLKDQELLEPAPGIGDLAKLRARLSLADKFPDERTASQQYLREAEDLRKKVEALTSQLRAWPQASGIYCLADEATRLRYRLMGIIMTPDFEPNFRDDFAGLKGRIADKVSIEIGSYTLPEVLDSDEAKNEVQGLLWRTIGALKSYAASLLGTPESPTTS